MGHFCWRMFSYQSSLILVLEELRYNNIGHVLILSLSIKFEKRMNHRHRV